MTTHQEAINTNPEIPDAVSKMIEELKGNDPRVGFYGGKFLISDNYLMDLRFKMAVKGRVGDADPSQDPPVVDEIYADIQDQGVPFERVLGIDPYGSAHEVRDSSGLVCLSEEHLRMMLADGYNQYASAPEYDY